MESFACSCCGYKTLDELGSYIICPICFWEDDPSQSDNPDLSGANRVSLKDAQKNYIEFQVCELEMKRFVRAPKAKKAEIPIGIS